MARSREARQLQIDNEFYIDRAIKLEEENHRLRQQVELHKDRARFYQNAFDNAMTSLDEAEEIIKDISTNERRLASQITYYEDRIVQREKGDGAQ